MRKLPLFESTKPNDLLTTVTYMGKEYPAVKIDIKNKMKDGSKAKVGDGNEPIHAIFGTKAMYDQMVDENDKLKGEEAVKLNGTLSGYLNITDKSMVSDIMKEVEACIGDWAEVVTKIDEAKMATIEGEFLIGLDDLIKVFKGQDENAAEIEQGIRAGRYDKFMAKTIGHKELVQSIKYVEMDSANMSHGSAHFMVKLRGPIPLLKKVAGPDLPIYYDWEDVNEGLFDRLKAAGAGAVAGAKAAVNNKVQGVVNKVKAVGQAVTGLKKGDLSQAQATLQNAPKKVDPKLQAAKTKAVSIINSMYNDLQALFPGKDVVNPLKTLYQSLTESKEENLSAKDYELGDKIRYTFSDPKIKGGKEQVRTGEIVDHFGDGVMVKLHKPIIYFSSEKHNKSKGNFGYQEHNSELSTDFFELYDGEDNEYGSLNNLSKISLPKLDETLVKETWARMDKLADQYGEGDTGWDELLDDFCRKLSDDKINSALDHIIQMNDIKDDEEEDTNEAHAETWEKLEKVKEFLGGSKETMESMVRAMSDDDVNGIFDLMDKEFAVDDTGESKVIGTAAIAADVRKLNKWLGGTARQDKEGDVRHGMVLDLLPQSRRQDDITDDFLNDGGTFTYQWLSQYVKLPKLKKFIDGLKEDNVSEDKTYDREKRGKLVVHFKIVDIADDDEPYSDLDQHTIELDCGKITGIKYDDSCECYNANFTSEETDIEKLEDLLFDELGEKIDSMLGLSVESVDIEKIEKISESKTKSLKLLPILK